MSVPEFQPAVPKPNFRRFHLTPGHRLAALLAIDGLLFLSQWFRWLPKGWPVLIAISSVPVVMLGMVVWYGVTLVLLWRFQFSIRLLLVLVVVVAVPFSWMAVGIKQARPQAHMVSEVERLGGRVDDDLVVFFCNAIPP